MQVITGPKVEPITLQQAKEWCRVDDDLTADDDVIEMLIIAAREFAEQYTNSRFITQTLQQDFNPDEIELRIGTGPVQQVTAVNVDGIDLAADDYTEKTINGVVVITLNDAPQQTAYVQFVAGYGESPHDVPNPALLAIRKAVATYYENRTDQVKQLPTASEYLLNTVRRWVT